MIYLLTCDILKVMCEQCDFFNITDYSATLDDDDWVTTWTLRYIER